jgi:hypothetical protein
MRAARMPTVAPLLFPNAVREQSSLQSIRLSADVSNPLSRSRN